MSNTNREVLIAQALEKILAKEKPNANEQAELLAYVK